MTLTNILTIICVAIGIYAILDLRRLEKRLKNDDDLLDTRRRTTNEVDGAGARETPNSLRTED